MTRAAHCGDERLRPEAKIGLRGFVVQSGDGPVGEG